MEEKLHQELVMHPKEKLSWDEIMFMTQYLVAKIKRYKAVPEAVYVFTRYPLLGEPLREDGKHNTGMMVYAWFKFNKNYREEPIIRWLDNDSYILKKGE